MIPILSFCLLLFVSSSHASLEEAPQQSLSSTDFLKEIVKEIAAKELWDLKAGVRISEFDAGSALVGDSQRYEFQIRVGRGVLTMRFSEVELWRQLESDEGLDLGAQGGVVGDLELEGPLDVHVGGGDGELTLRLPAMSMTRRGIQRVVVGAGIKIKVKGARQVSLAHPFGAQVVLNEDLGTTADSVETSKFSLSPLGQSSCSPVLSVRVVGTASIVACKTHNSKASIGTKYHSHNTVELLPDKCYSSMHYQPIRSSLHTSFHSKLVQVEKRLLGVLGYPVFQDKSTRFLKAKITSPTLVKFQMELERNITAKDRSWKTVPAWRTRPITVRQSLDIVARVGGGLDLEPSIVKKVKRAYTVVDSKADRMSNISFPLFPPAVSQPGALTLDVKW